MATINNKLVTVESLKAVQDYNKEIYITEFEPTGSGSLSLNRKVDTDIGLNSVAVGSDTSAIGDYSYAEGLNTVASGTSSHASGLNTTASAECAYTEGSETIASGISSHAEGDTTTASGYASHAEGYNTIASSQYQHVQGRYNIEDADDIYAFIVGNGDTDDEGNGIRSNAHTLDWNGNVWFAGDFNADGNMILSSNQYGDELPTAGNVGRIFFKRLVE